MLVVGAASRPNLIGLKTKRVFWGFTLPLFLHKPDLSFGLA